MKQVVKNEMHETNQSAFFGVRNFALSKRKRVGQPRTEDTNQLLIHT